MEALMTLDFSKYSPKIVEIIKLFEKIGWQIYNLNGKIEYLPINDRGEYNWKCENISENELYEIFETKQKAKEQIGINLYYRDSLEGLSLIACDAAHVILGISINRRIINNNHTDIIWYYSNIIKKLTELEIELPSYSIEEYTS